MAEYDFCTLGLVTGIDCSLNQYTPWSWDCDLEDCMDSSPPIENFASKNWKLNNRLKYQIKNGNKCSLRNLQFPVASDRNVIQMLHTTLYGNGLTHLHHGCAFFGLEKFYPSYVSWNFERKSSLETSLPTRCCSLLSRTTCSPYRQTRLKSLSVFDVVLSSPYTIMTAACCCPWVANCVVALRFATAIGGSFIKLCGPVLAAFQLSGAIVGVVGVPGTVATVPGTVPFVCGKSGEATKG